MTEEPGGSLNVVQALNVQTFVRPLGACDAVAVVDHQNCDNGLQPPRLRLHDFEGVPDGDAVACTDVGVVLGTSNGNHDRLGCRRIHGSSVDCQEREADEDRQASDNSG